MTSSASLPLSCLAFTPAASGAAAPDARRPRRRLARPVDRGSGGRLAVQARDGAGTVSLEERGPPMRHGMRM